MQLDSRATLYFMFRKALLWVIVAAWLAVLFAPGASTAHPHPGMQWVPLYGMLWHMVPFLALLLALDGFVCYLRTKAYRIDPGHPDPAQCARAAAGPVDRNHSERHGTARVHPGAQGLDGRVAAR
jgi:hypothetical protein